MKSKYAIIAFTAAILAAAPLAPAHAEDHHHGRSGSGLFLGLFAAGITGAAVALATAPHAVVVEAPPPPPPVYVAPAPVYYSYAPAYAPVYVYPHRHLVTYYAPYPAYAVYR